MGGDTIEQEYEYRLTPEDEYEKYETLSFKA
jgi:hypothetical protein